MLRDLALECGCELCDTNAHGESRAPSRADRSVSTPADHPRDDPHSDARWAGYEERDALPLIEDRSWVELAPEILERHAALLVHTGGALYRAILPAYLLVIIEHEYSTSLPFHVVTQLTCMDSNVDREILNERVGPMTAEQRDVVRRAISIIAEQPLLRDVASDAIRSW